MPKKISLVLAATLFALPMFVFAETSSTPSPQDLQGLQTIITQLQAQVKALQTQVAALQGELGKQQPQSAPAGEAASATPQIPATSPAPSEPAPPELTRSLSRGSSGDDVRRLQEFLAKDKDIYPDGLITGYFGPLTETAVKKWQEKHGVESAGVIGPKTLAKFQEIGKAVVQGLLDQGAGQSGIVPQGLMTAPGIQNRPFDAAQGRLGIAATSSLAQASTMPASATTTFAGTTTTVAVATTTLSGTPILPAQPSAGNGGFAPAAPAAPASTQATTAATSTTTTATSTASTATSTDILAPSAPNVAYAISSTRVDLSWTPSTDNVGVAGYKINRGGSLLVSFATTTTGTLYYGDTNLSPGTTYAYTVVAYDAAGNVSLPNSASITTLSGTADTQPPSTPINLSASAVSTSQINLSWSTSTDNVGVTGYKVYRGGTQIATVVASSTSLATPTYYSSAELQSSTTYTYAVAAYDAAGNTSAQSASASATTNSFLSSIPTPPDAPVIASITPYTPLALNEHFISSIALQWNAVPNSTRYNTYYKAWRRLGGGDWLYWANTQQTAFFNLNIGRGTYYYKVNACSTTTGSPLVLATDICGPDSNIMTATLAGGGGASDTTSPSTPTVLRVWNPDSFGYGRNFISWTESTDNVGVAGYNIYRNGTYLESVCCTPAEDDFASFSPTYAYTVAAYDAAGNVSTQSNQVSATTPVAPATSTTATSTSLLSTNSNLASILSLLSEIAAGLQKLLR